MGMSFEYRVRDARQEQIRLQRLSRRRRIAVRPLSGVFPNGTGERLAAAAVGALIGLSIATLWIATTSLWHAF